MGLILHDAWMISETKKRILKFYNNGYALYKKREWNKAIKEFEKGLKLDSDDGPSKLYFFRCKYFMENPPPEDWDGVFTMIKK